MSLDAVRSALVAMIAAVPEVGRVHAWQRYSREENEFQQLYVWAGAQSVDHVRGWCVRNVNGEERTLGVGRVLMKDSWEVRGYLSLNDELASELIFDGLIEAIRAAYRADPTLGGACAAEMWGDGPDGVQKADSAPVIFCGVLCHSAVLTVDTWRYAT